MNALVGFTQPRTQQLTAQNIWQVVRLHMTTSC